MAVATFAKMAMQHSPKTFCNFLQKGVAKNNIEPNTEFKLEYSQDETGVEYSNLVSSQNINEIELYVSSIDN